jgi:hypothetical protein
MNCYECDQIWNQLLDAEPLPRARVAAGLEPSPQLLAELEQAACTHAQGCTRCRQARARYETLRRALRAWVSTPRPATTVSPTLIERILAEQAAGSIRRASRWRAALPLGAAAAAVACLIVLVLAPLPRRPQGALPGGDRAGAAGPASASAARPSNRAADSRILSSALADATAATWDLARTTSEPAARLGRQVFERATQPENPSRAAASAADPAGPSYSGLDSFTAVLPVVSQSPPGSALLQQMGDGLSAGVRPLSSNARQAFGFLRIPSLEKTGNSPLHQPASKGA